MSADLTRTPSQSGLVRGSVTLFISAGARPKPPVYDPPWWGIMWGTDDAGLAASNTYFHILSSH